MERQMVWLTYIFLWFVVSCITAPFIGALLARNLEATDEYHGENRYPEPARARAYRMAGQSAAFTPALGFPGGRLAVVEAAKPVSRRQRG
jgi:hypothetical protein